MPAVPMRHTSATSLSVMHLLKHASRGNGSVHVAVDLACAQADAGYSVYFASARGEYDDILRAHGVNVETLPEPSTAAGAIRSTRALIKLVRRVRPDLLHAHMMSSAVLAYPISKIFRSPLTTTVHNSFDSHSWLMRLGRLVVAVSEAERTLLLSRGYSPRRVRTVLNGVVGSAREALPVHDIGPLRQPSIVTLSGLHRRKAVDDVISAFALIAKRFPEWSLEIIGWGPAMPELEQQVRELKLESRIRFLGSTITPWPLLIDADIFATATVAEPFGLSIAEARAAGCAIVATNVGGVSEVLDGGEAGILVPVHDPAAMAQAFGEMLGDEEKLDLWKARAKQGSDYFSVERMQADYHKAYLTVLSSRRKKILSQGVNS